MIQSLINIAYAFRNLSVAAWRLARFKLQHRGGQ